ncbi:competence type IV pilus minor pilin ComGG [Enterococcus sp. LJL99]
MTTLLFFFLFSFLFLTILEDFKLTQQFYFETKDFYIAKMMVHLFLTTEKIPAEKGEITFSAGTLLYNCEGESVSMQITVNKKQYFFEEIKISR